MGISFRSCLTAGVATITAAALAFGPSVHAPAPAAAPPLVQIAAPPIELTAQVQPTVTATSLPDLLVGWLQRIVVPPSAGQPFPTPQFPPAIAPTSVGTSIKGIYNAVEPWVRYGFELATYAVGWVPYVGWLAPQIMIFYNFGERIARSITFNVADWIDGNITFAQGLGNVAVDTINSFIFLANDQLAFWLPPLPPIPPLPFAAAQTTTAVQAAPAIAGTTQVKSRVNEKRGLVAGGGAVEVAKGTTAAKPRESTKVSTTKGPSSTSASNAKHRAKKDGNK